MMIHRQAAVIAAIVVGLMLVGALWGLGHFSAGAHVPLHFGADGVPDRWSDAATGIFYFPGVGAFLWLLFAVIPRVDPRRKNLARSAQAYGLIWVAVTTLIAFLQGVATIYALGGTFNIARVVPTAVGALFVVIGNVLGKVRPNFFVGIRTPWTLADEHVWDKTHRFGGWIFVLGGIAIILAAVVLRDRRDVGPAVLGITLITALLPVLHSYLLSRNRKAS